MKSAPEPKLSPRLHEAVEELKNLIKARYPEAMFRVVRDPEERRSIDILAMVDVDDRQVVSDLVRERVLDLQLREKFPVHVIPLRTPDRARALLEQQRHEHRFAVDIPSDLLAPLRLQLEAASPARRSSD